MAIDIERNVLGESGGWQDQIAAAYGGVNLTEFIDGGYKVTRLPISRQRLREMQDHCMVIFTGVTRKSYDVLEEQVSRNKSGDNTAVLNKLADLAREGAQFFCSNERMAGFGELLDKGWHLKQSLAELSLPVADSIYQTAKKNGATGGKLLGAGKGGFFLIWAEPKYHDKIKASLDSEFIDLDFRLNAPGANILHSC